MVQRPTSVTVIAVIQLVFGVIGVFGAAATFLPRSAAAEAREAERFAKLPVPAPIQRAIPLAGAIVSLTTGYYLLRGKNWARMLYMAWNSATLVYGFVVAGAFRWMAIPGLVIFLVITFFLFRPRANAFFADDGASLAEQPRPTAARVASFVCYVFAGFMFSCSCMMAFMNAPFGGAKVMVVCMFLLPAAVLLSIGRMLSPERLWAREVGIVLVASSCVGALIVLGIELMFHTPEFQQSIPAGRTNVFNDYFTGCLWIALLATFGAMWLLAARRQAQEKPVRAPIYGTKHR